MFKVTDQYFRFILCIKILHFHPKVVPIIQCLTTFPCPRKNLLEVMSNPKKLEPLNPALDYISYVYEIPGFKVISH